MNEREHKNFSEYVKKCTKRAKADKEYARKMLMSTGMYTPTGKLKKEFK